MGDIKERLDRLKLKIQTEDFLWGKGLSNEVNIWIFCYEPVEEMTVHHFVEGLVVEQNLKCRVHSYNLYDVFLDICRKKNILSKIPAMEEKKGKDYLLRQLHSITTEFAFINQMNFEPQTRGTDMILLSGVGDVFPFKLKEEEGCAIIHAVRGEEYDPSLEDDLTLPQIRESMRSLILLIEEFETANHCTHRLNEEGVELAETDYEQQIDIDLNLKTSTGESTIKTQREKVTK